MEQGYGIDLEAEHDALVAELREEAKTDKKAHNEIQRMEEDAKSNTPPSSVKGEALAIALATKYYNEKRDEYGIELFDRLHLVGRREEARAALKAYAQKLDAKLQRGELTDKEFSIYEAVSRLERD